MDLELGAKIRSLRQKQNLSIEQVAERSGLSKGLISQIERDMTGPTVASLWKIAKALNVNINYFFDEENEFEPLVRKDERKIIQVKGKRKYELLCPDLKRAIEMLWIEIEPGESSSRDLISHDGEECGVVIRGKLQVVCGEKTYHLNEGDSIYLDSTTPHRYFNISNEPCTSVWAMVPPSF